jgi:hypothetical protein
VLIQNILIEPKMPKKAKNAQKIAFIAHLPAHRVLHLPKNERCAHLWAGL